MARLILLLTLLWQLPALAIDPDELLPVDEAFRVSARAAGPDAVELRWQIAPGYYLYRDKFKFDSQDPVRLGAPQLPPGEVKDDPNFGRLEVFHREVVARLPIERSDPNLTTLHLQVGYQGCAEAGVCYPPQRKMLTVALAPAPAAAAPSAPKPAPINVLQDLREDVIGSGEPELLPADEAFAFRARLEAPDRLVASWVVAEGYYLYRDKIRLRSKTPGVTLGEPQLPPAEQHDDPQFGSVAIYRGPVDVTYPIRGLSPQVESLEIEARYQGCADLGVCYPPITKTLRFTGAELAALREAAGAQPSAAAGAEGAPPAAAPAPEAAPATEATAPLSEQDRIGRMLADRSIWFNVLAFFGFGLLLSLTPCVFPMIPILSGIIVGQGRTTSTRQAFLLSLAYVLAMALTYTVVGVLAGLFGANIQAWFQNPWILTGFALLFVLLALSMFGFYELQMPSAIQSRLSLLSNRQEGGRLTSAAVMGFLSALIVGPCVTAPLIGALIYIGHTGDAVLGGLALFSLSLGMGTPLLLIGTSAGKLLPKAGPWMDAIKAFFGVLLLGVAIWLLARILPAAVTMLLWGVLAVVSGVYLGALTPPRPEGSRWQLFWKGLGVVVLLVGALEIVGAAAGGDDPLQPLRGLLRGGGGGGAATAEAEGLPFQRIKGLRGLEDALATARAQGRPVMLDFYADWCISCKELEKFTFSDPQVRAALQGVMLLQADVTANDAEDRALLKRFDIIGPPAILFFGPDGKERRAYRVVGYMPAAAFRDQVRKALSR